MFKDLDIQINTIKSINDELEEIHANMNKLSNIDLTKVPSSKIDKITELTIKLLSQISDYNNNNNDREKTTKEVILSHKIFFLINLFFILFDFFAFMLHGCFTSAGTFHFICAIAQICVALLSIKLFKIKKV